MPLSPLLFTLSLDPFLCKIRLSPDIQALPVGGIQCKISTYAEDIHTISTSHFPPLIAKTHTLFENWHKGLHSWFGRCKLIKMCIVPKFLNLFQSLSFLNKLKLSSPALYGLPKKTPPSYPNISGKTKHGGVALPDIRKYYQAIHEGRVLNWQRHSVSQLWV